MNIEMKKLLKGYKLGEVQTAGIMSIIPILTKTEYTPIGDFNAIYLKNDKSYGCMEIGNDSEYISIVPHGMAFISKESAQDRTIPETHLIKLSKDCDSNCIQDSQCGHFKDTFRETEKRFIPASLMLKAWNPTNNTYSFLWDAIRDYNRSTQKTSRAYMVDFYQKFDKDIQEFIAQFEAVDNQVGAVVFINDRLHGIELVPNYKMWQQIWRPLIRDCYGSDSIYISKNQDINTFRPSMDIQSVESLDDLQEQLNKAYADIETHYKDKLKELIDMPTQFTKKQDLEDHFVYHTSNDLYTGDLVTHGSHTIYMSMITGNGYKSKRNSVTVGKARWEGTDNDPYSNCTDFEL